MGIAFVRKATNSKTSSSTSTTVTISTDPGNLLVVTCIFVNGSSSTAFSSVSDTAGNTWTLPSSMSDSNPPAAYVGGLGTCIAYAEAADAITTVTFHYPSCAKFYAVVSEYSGAAATGARSASGQSLSSSTDTITTPANGLCVAAACTSNATSITGGFTQLLKTSGNLAGYLIEGGSSASEHMGWSPTQNAAGAIIAFKPATATTTQGTATLTEAESLSAAVTVPLTATLTETESLSAVSASNPQLAISAVPNDQTDPHGIPVRHGMTAYHWASSTATQYDRYASVQDGQIASGAYNAAADVNLYRASADHWKTDDSLEVAGTLKVSGNTGTASAMATCPTSSTTGTFVAFTGAQWPALTITVPPSETVLVNLRLYGYNSNSASSNLDVCAQVKQGSTVLVSPTQGLGPHIISRVSGSSDVFLGFAEITIGTDLLSGMAGQTLTITPYWRISSGNIGPTGQASQSATINSASMRALPSLYSCITSL